MRCPCPSPGFGARRDGSTAARLDLATAALPGNSVRLEDDGRHNTATGFSTARADQKDKRASWGTVLSESRGKLRSRVGTTVGSREKCRVKPNCWMMIMSGNPLWTLTMRLRSGICGCS